nr:hypothetical protein CFP56_00798 [Quercus suber]
MDTEGCDVDIWSWFTDQEGLGDRVREHVAAPIAKFQFTLGLTTRISTSVSGHALTDTGDVHSNSDPLLHTLIRGGETYLYLVEIKATGQTGWNEPEPIVARRCCDVHHASSGVGICCSPVIVVRSSSDRIRPSDT